MAPGGRWTLMPFQLLGAGAQCAEARVWVLPLSVASTGTCVPPHAYPVSPGSVLPGFLYNSSDGNAIGFTCSPALREQPWSHFKFGS